MNIQLSIILPCFNEAKGIADVIKHLPRQDCEIIVVDNNSIDQTADIARAAGARVVFESKQGYGNALKAGFAAAQGSYIITLDGDGQYPADKIMEVLRFAIDNKYDFVSCSRFPLKNRRALSLTRIVGNRFLTTLGNILFNISLSDNQTGMFLYRRAIFTKITPRHHDMPLSQEIKIRAFCDQTLVSGEFWIPYTERLGNSKLFPIRHGIMNTMALFKLRYEFLKKQLKIRAQ